MRQPDESYESEIEQAFDNLLHDENIGLSQECAKQTLAHLGTNGGDTHDLFCEIASGYSGPLKDFLFEINRGLARREWVEYCRPTLRALLKGAEQMNFPGEILDLFQKFDELLAQAESCSQHLIPLETQRRIVAAYEELEEKIPKIFQRDSSSHKREKTILESLLFQVPGIGKKTIQQLSAVGLTSLQTFSLVNVFDLSAVSGISLGRCRQICQVFHKHSAWLESIPPEKHDFIMSEKLKELTLNLNLWKRKRAKNREEAHASNSSPHFIPTIHNKKVTLLKIRLILAELNQISLLQSLEKKRISQIIRQLDFFLSTFKAFTKQSAST
jgi:hypothetical protein